MYGDYVPKRYPGASRLPASCPVSKDDSECNVREWDTAEGRVLLELRDDRLLVLEGMDETVTERARTELF